MVDRRFDDLTRLARSTSRRQALKKLASGTSVVWPARLAVAARVPRIERTWHEHQTAKRAVSYAITSLEPARADPATLPALNRGHWAIENRLHRAKDLNLAEDARLVHAGQGPQVMTLLRDTAMSLLHATGVRQTAARLRHHSQHPDQAVALVLGALTTHA